MILQYKRQVQITGPMLAPSVLAQEPRLTFTTKTFPLAQVNLTIVSLKHLRRN